MKAPARAFIRRITLDGRDVTNSAFIPVRGGALSIELAAAHGRLHGRVNFDSSEIPEGVRVTLAPTANQPDLERTIIANSKGEFIVSDLAPATYKIYAWEKFDPYLMESPEFRDFFPSTTVQIDGSAQQDVQIDLIPSTLIETAKARF